MVISLPGTTSGDTRWKLQRASTAGTAAITELLCAEPQQQATSRSSRARASTGRGSNVREASRANRAMYSTCRVPKQRTHPRICR
jgi:hypothetical protein